MASLTPISGPLGRERAAHLLKRAAFGGTRQEIDNFSMLTIEQALDQLFTPVAPPDPPADPATGAPWVNPKPGEANSDEGDLIRYFLGWWIDQMLRPQPNVTERITYFYHTHFTTRTEVVRSSTALYHQNRLFRYYAMGNFRDLCKKICLDNAMLQFLDGRLNVIGRPQENFGREFLELYTIGKGPQIGPEDYTYYTELDVQEAAKVLSGYDKDDDYLTLDPETGIPSGFLKGNGITAGQHDPSPKTFSDKFQGTVIAPPNPLINGRATVEDTLDELDQLVAMVFSQEQTAQHICRKLYRFFAYYIITPEVEQDIIVPLAETFRNNDYELEPVLRQLFASEHFFDEDNTQTEDNVRGALIKSPLDLCVMALRYFNLELPASEADRYEIFYKSGILRFMSQMGMDFYNPPEVAGYPAYHQTPEFNRNWISANNLARRYQLSDRLMRGENAGGDDLMVRLDIVDYVRNQVSEPSIAAVIVDELVADLLPEIITDERKDYFLTQILLDNLSQMNWEVEWNNYINSGDDTGIRTQLESLLNALMQSPEYQLM